MSEGCGTKMQRARSAQHAFSMLGFG